MLPRTTTQRTRQKTSVIIRDIVVADRPRIREPLGPPLTPVPRSWFISGRFEHELCREDSMVLTNIRSVSDYWPVQARLDAAQMPLPIPNWHLGYATSVQLVSAEHRSEQTETPAS